MGAYKKVIFVSEDGTCRSILAKAIYEKIKRDSEVEVLSRGLVVLFEEPVNPKAVAIAKCKGLSIENEFSQQLREGDFSDENLIIVMTDLLKKKIYEKFENALNVYSIREFTGNAVDVETLVGGELADYGNRYEYLEELILALREKIEE